MPTRFIPELLVASSSTHLVSYGLCRTTEDRLFNQHRAAGLQEISVRIVSSPFHDRLPYRDLEVLNLIGSERINEGGIVGKIGFGYDYDIVVHELRPNPAPPFGQQYVAKVVRGLRRVNSPRIALTGVVKVTGFTDAQGD